VIEYGRYIFSKTEWLKVVALGSGVAGAVSYTFYRSWMVFGIILVPTVILGSRFCREHWKKKRLEQLESQFKEMIQVLSASLNAGYSVENALSVSRRELEMMYGEAGMIVQELDYMIRQINVNRSVESVMDDFAGRSGLEEVENFAYIFGIAKRSGGRLISIISHTVRIMQDRLAVKEEIRTLTASRKFEQEIMSLMPFLMILYIDRTSPGFFTVMYTTLMGRIVMSGCLMIYLVSCYLSAKILDIRVG